MAGWTLHNSAAAVLLAIASAWAVGTIMTSVVPGRVQIATAVTSDSLVAEIPRTERSRSDLTGLAPLFGLTEATAPAPDEVGTLHAEPSWQNYAPPVLVGVAVLPDHRLAILRLASGQTRVFTEGQQWEDFTVTSVLAGSVHLERGDSIRVLSLVQSP